MWDHWFPLPAGRKILVGRAGAACARTPAIGKLSGENKPGRDHWGNAMSVFMAGGGIVVGSTDRKGYAADTRVLSPENFVSTIYTKLGINPDKMLFTPQGRPTHLVSDPAPIRELM